MLIEFEVGNFLSFREPVRLSMVAANPIKEFVDDNVFEAGRHRLLKSAVVYGANAGGKSNLLTALTTMRWLVMNSSKETQATEPIWVTPFKFDADTENQPSRFEVLFQVDGIRYRYGYEASSKRVESEWLFQARKGAETALFVRKGDAIEVRSAFREGRSLEVRTRENALFLSVVAQFNGETSVRVVKWFRDVMPLHGLRDQSYAGHSIEMLKDEKRRPQIVEFVRKADVGIEDIAISEDEIDLSRLPTSLSEEVKRVLLQHLSDARAATLGGVIGVHAKFAKGVRVGTVGLDFDDAESEGTKKFFRLAGPVLTCLESGRIAVVDELDAKLHPLLTRAVVRLFNSRETNPRNAQLVCCTHDTNLLNWPGSGGFRRDQIWFVEKNREGATDLYSLAEFIPKVRNDAAFEKNYIQGRYGAIPYVGDFAVLFQEEGDGESSQVQ